MIDRIYDVWKRERMNRKITPISIAFYGALREKLKEWERRINEEKDNLSKKVLQRQYERIKFVIEDIIKIRTQKLIKMALVGEEIKVNVAKEEMALYEKIRKAFDRYIKEIFAPEEIIFIEEKREEKIKEEKPILEYTPILFEREVSERIMGFDGQFYGPFKEGDIVIIPKENATGLIKHKIAEQIKTEHEI